MTEGERLVAVGWAQSFIRDAGRRELLFDLETAFLFPWGVALREIGWPGFIAMGVFLLEFIVGFVYIWKKGALDWAETALSRRK